MSIEIRQLLKLFGTAEEIENFADILTNFCKVSYFKSHFVLRRNRQGPTPDCFEIFPQMTDSGFGDVIDQTDSDYLENIIEFAASFRRTFEPVTFFRANDALQFSKMRDPLNDDEGALFDFSLTPMPQIAGDEYILLLLNGGNDISMELCSNILLLAMQLHLGLKRCLNDNSVRNTRISRREHQVLSWTSQGKTSFEIAKILELSEHTINNYIVNVTKKLGATNRNHAVARAIHLALI